MKKSEICLTDQISKSTTQLEYRPPILHRSTELAQHLLISTFNRITIILFYFYYKLHTRPNFKKIRQIFQI